MACDELPKRPKKWTPQAYIVNTDRQGEPGQHWLALWTEGTVCELMDSFVLPLEHYQATPLERWIRMHWTHLVKPSPARVVDIIVLFIYEKKPEVVLCKIF